MNKPSIQNSLMSPSEVIQFDPECPWTVNEIGQLFRMGLLRGKRSSRFTLITRESYLILKTFHSKRILKK